MCAHTCTHVYTCVHACVGGTHARVYAVLWIFPQGVTSIKEGCHAACRSTSGWGCAERLASAPHHLLLERKVRLPIGVSLAGAAHWGQPPAVWQGSGGSHPTPGAHPPSSDLVTGLPLGSPTCTGHCQAPMLLSPSLATALCPFSLSYSLENKQ